MRGQIALETLIVLAAVAGALLLLMDNYVRIFDVVVNGLEKKKVEYVAGVIRDATRGCQSSGIVVELPFSVEILCSADLEVKVGEQSESIEGAVCGNGGKGKKIRVDGCRVDII